MKTLPYIALLATFTLPLSANAQIVHIEPDPEPKTVRCQNSTTAYHSNSDIVRVDYHGQWRDYPDGRRSQNGGPDYTPCATERIARIDPHGETVWELRSDDTQPAFSPTDIVRDLVAHPDGSTLISVGDGSLRDQSISTVLLVDPNGRLRWTLRTTRAPKFSTARISLGDDNKVFVTYGTTNYGYDGGTFQLPGGRVWTLGKNEYKTIVARLDLEHGRIGWEREGGAIVSAHGGEILVHGIETQGRSPMKTRHRLERWSYDGKPLSSHRTQWFASETSYTVVRKAKEVWMTTAAEILNSEKPGVDHRISNLRVFNLKGKLLHTRKLSDSAKLATPTQGAPMRIVSPTQCDRGVGGREPCTTSSFHVLSLDSWSEKGTTTRVQVPSHRFRTRDFRAHSTETGVWISGETQYDSPHSQKPAIAVTTLHSTDSTRALIDNPRRLVWRPIQAPKSAPPALGF